MYLLPLFHQLTLFSAVKREPVDFPVFAGSHYLALKREGVERAEGLLWDGAKGHGFWHWGGRCGGYFAVVYNYAALCSQFLSSPCLYYYHITISWLCDRSSFLSVIRWRYILASSLALLSPPLSIYIDGIPLIGLETYDDEHGVVQLMIIRQCPVCPSSTYYIYKVVFSYETVHVYWKHPPCPCWNIYIYFARVPD